MSWVALGSAAIAAGGQIGSSLLSRRNRSNYGGGYPNFYVPSYVPSKYDAPSAEQLYGIYSRRAGGQDVGFTEEDLGQMRGEAIDETARMTNELVSRGMAGRYLTGGQSTGGMNRLREKALTTGLMARSQAMRDISIRNAVLKRQETWQGITGLHQFLNDERLQAQRLFSNELARAGIINQNMLGGFEEGQKNLAFSQALGQQDIDLLFSQIENFSKFIPGLGSGGGVPGTGASNTANLDIIFRTLLQQIMSSGGTRGLARYR